MDLQSHLASSVVEWLSGELTKPMWHWLKFRKQKIGDIQVDGLNSPKIGVYEILFTTNPRFCDANVRCRLLLTPENLIFSPQRIDLDDIVLDYADPKLFDNLLILVNRIPSMA